MAISRWPDPPQKTPPRPVYGRINRIQSPFVRATEMFNNAICHIADPRSTKSLFTHCIHPNTDLSLPFLRVLRRRTLPTDHLLPPLPTSSTPRRTPWQPG